MTVDARLAIIAAAAIAALAGCSARAALDGDASTLDTSAGDGLVSGTLSLPLTFETRAVLSYPNGTSSARPPDGLFAVIELARYDRTSSEVELTLGAVCRQSGVAGTRAGRLVRVKLLPRAGGGYRLWLPAVSRYAELPYCQSSWGYSEVYGVVLAELELELDASLQTLSGTLRGEAHVRLDDVSNTIPVTGVISGARDSTPPSIRGVTSPLGPLDAISISFDEPLRAQSGGAALRLRDAQSGAIVETASVPADGKALGSVGIGRLGHWPLGVALTLELVGLVDLAGLALEGGGTVTRALPAIASPPRCDDLGFEGGTDPICGCERTASRVGPIQPAQGSRLCDNVEGRSLSFTLQLPADAVKLQLSYVACASQVASRARFSIVVASLATSVRASFTSDMPTVVSGGAFPCEYATDWTDATLDVRAVAGQTVVVQLSHHVASGGPPQPPTQLLLDNLRVQRAAP
ncbi:MAG: hypothetical protein KC503_31815 [Myxococcales bacterium]|nr:hypothetical protein [Myxococcales bacterium]